MNQIDNLQALHQMTPEEYPVLYKALHNYNGALLHRLEQLHEVAREHAESKWFFASVDYLIARFGGSASTWQSNKAYLSDIGLIRTRKPGSKTLSSALQESKKRAGKGRKAVSWYHIPDYTPERLKQAESKAERFKAKGINRKGLTMQGSIIAMGQREAQKALVDYRTRSERDRAMEKEFIRQIQMSINRKGYALKEQAITRTVKRISHAFKLDMTESFCLARNLWSNRNKRLLSMAGASYHRPNRTEKERFHLKGNGWIITPAAK